MTRQTLDNPPCDPQEVIRLKSLDALIDERDRLLSERQTAEMKWGMERTILCARLTCANVEIVDLRRLGDAMASAPLTDEVVYRNEKGEYCGHDEVEHPRHKTARENWRAYRAKEKT